MKLFFLLLALLGYATAQTRAGEQSASQPPPPAAQQDPNTQKARLLINQAIHALGGEAYLNIHDVQQQGRTYSFYHGRSTGGGAPFWRFWKWPDMERIELTKQRDVVYIHTGDKGFEITFKGTRAEDPKDLKQYLVQRDFSLENVLRRWLNQPGVALFYEGKSLAANKMADQVTLMNAQDQSVTLYLDSDTHLPLKKLFTVRDPVSREKDEEVEIYDNYHLIQGINTPLNIVRQHNGEMQRQRFLDSVVYNPSLADTLFAAKITYDPNVIKTR